MQLIKQSEATAARRTIHFQAINSADNSAYTSTLSGADLKILKNDGTEADSAGTATHEGGGRFSYVFTTGEIDTFGILSVRLNKAGVFADVFPVQVVAFDPYAASNMGMSFLDAAVASRLATTSYQTPSTLLDAENGIETGMTLRQAMRLMAAILGGRVSGAQTGVEVFRNAVADSKNRVTATLDSSGNRINIITELT
jgi:hypothetical protein